MKNALFIVFLLIVLAGCKQATDKTVGADLIKNPNTLTKKDPNKKYPTITFDTLKWDFGSINPGDVVYHDFHFKNTGDAVLVIQDVVPSCGCTSPSWSKDPIAPGESGIVHIKFDSHGKSGKQAKTATVVANTYPNETPLRIYAEIH